MIYRIAFIITACLVALVSCNNPIELNSNLPNDEANVIKTGSEALPELETHSNVAPPDNKISKKANSNEQDTLCGATIQNHGVTQERIQSGQEARNQMGDAALVIHYSLNSNDENQENKKTAIDTKSICNQSETPQLVLQSNLMLIGTLICKGSKHCESENVNDVEIDDLLNDCSFAMNHCSFQDKEIIGRSLQDIHANYCSLAKHSNEGICANINKAFDSSQDSNPSEFADKVFELWIHDY